MTTDITDLTDKSGEPGCVHRLHVHARPAVRPPSSVPTNSICPVASTAPFWRTNTPAASRQARQVIHNLLSRVEAGNPIQAEAFLARPVLATPAPPPGLSPTLRLHSTRAHGRGQTRREHVEGVRPFPGSAGRLPCYVCTWIDGDTSRRPQEAVDMDRLEPSKLKEPNNEPGNLKARDRQPHALEGVTSRIPPPPITPRAQRPRQTNPPQAGGQAPAAWARLISLRVACGDLQRSAFILSSGAPRRVM